MQALPSSTPTVHPSTTPQYQHPLKSTPPRMEQVTTSYRLLLWPEYRKSDTSLALTPLVAPQVGYAQYATSPPRLIAELPLQGTGANANAKRPTPVPYRFATGKTAPRTRVHAWYSDVSKIQSRPRRSPGRPLEARWELSSRNSEGSFLTCIHSTTPSITHRPYHTVRRHVRLNHDT